MREVCLAGTLSGVRALASAGSMGVRSDLGELKIVVSSVDFDMII